MGEEMGFDEALKHIKAGRAVRRIGWNGKGMSVRILSPDQTSDMALPYVYLRLPSAETVPWAPSQTDLLAEDWVKV